MGDYVFIRDDEAEITFVEDEEDDVQEEVETYYEENFWPKDEKENPCGFTFKGKKKIFNKAVENVLICFKNKGKIKDMKTLTFKVNDNRKTKYGSEIDVEITKNKEKGIAVLKIFGPKKESTIMINKSKKHDVKYVKILAVEVIKPLLDKFISGEGWKDLFTKITANVQKPLCKKCNKSFVSESNLKTHMKKYHTSVLFRSTKSKQEECVQNNRVDENKEPVTKMEVEENDTKLNDIKDIEEKMDIDEPVKEEQKKNEIEEKEKLERSRLRDEQIIERARKLEEKEKIFEKEKKEKEKKRLQEEEEKKEKEKIEQKKIKNAIKTKKKSLKKQKRKHENVTEIPTNIKHLVEEGSLQFLVQPDGACAMNAGAAHCFRDPKYGPQLRMVLNNHWADRWSYYKNHVSFPYVRKVGVKGDFVRFETGEEERFCEFLRSPDSAYLWSDNLDLQLLCNVYQMQIKVITTKGIEDQHPNVTWLSPNPELKKFQILPVGIVPNMTLIHYDEKHYNLVVPKNHELVETGTLSQLDKKVEHPVSDEEEPDKCQDEKLTQILKKYEESQALIQTLYQKIETLEKKLEDKEAGNAINESQSGEFIVKNKNHGFNRIGPQFEAVKKKPEVKHTCDLCDYVFDTKWQLDIHMNKHENKNSKCNVCEKKFKSKDRLNLHVKTTHENELEYNCNECSYQAHTKEELDAHFEATHLGHKINCHTCGKGFATKRELMVHRKADHLSLIKKCRYFLRGDCDFEDDVCWWRHDLLPADHSLNCSICERSFKTREELALHSRDAHAQQNIKEGAFKSRSENKSNKKDMDEENKSVFQDAQSSNHPPIMEKILSIVERLMEKVNILEVGKMKNQ